MPPLSTVAQRQVLCSPQASIRKAQGDFKDWGWKVLVRAPGTEAEGTGPEEEWKRAQNTHLGPFGSRADIQPSYI
jgi:hypothetical protein